VSPEERRAIEALIEEALMSVASDIGVDVDDLNLTARRTISKALFESYRIGARAKPRRSSSVQMPAVDTNDDERSG
jgi:hypothetical protein